MLHEQEAQSYQRRGCGRTAEVKAVLVFGGMAERVDACAREQPASKGQGACGQVAASVHAIPLQHYGLALKEG